MRIVLHLRTLHWNVVYSGTRAARQRPQIRTLPGQPSRRRLVPLLVDDRTHEAQIRRLVDEVPVAPQQQRLLDGRLRAEVRLLGDAVLMRLPRLDPRRVQPVVVQHLLETRRQLTPTAALQLVRRRRQVVVTKHRRHRPQHPQRGLQTGHQRLERLAQRQSHIRPLAVAQHPLEQQVRERYAPERHAQVARVREVERRFPTRNRHLLKVDLAIRTVLHPPLPDPPLQRPKLPRLKATRMTPAQRLEQRQHLQPAVGIGHQLRHHLRLPHRGERVLPRPPRPAAPSPSTATRRSATGAPSARSFPPPPRPPPTSSPTSVSLAIAEPAHP